MRERALGFTGNAAGLASFADAARERVIQRLPSAAKLSPSALPRDRAREAVEAARRAVARLIGARPRRITFTGDGRWI